MLMLCYVLSKLYNDREFEKSMYKVLQLVMKLKEYEGKDEEKKKTLPREDGKNGKTFF